MARTYFTLVSRNWQSQYDNQWAIEFGDYDRETVQSELEDYRDHGCPRKNLMILRTASDDQSTINAAVAALNGPTCRHCDNPPAPGYGNCLACAEEVGGDY